MSSYEAKEAPPKGMDISNKPAGDKEDMSKRDYIRWDAEGVERIPPNEAEDIQAVADMINCIQMAQWNNHRHCYSGKDLAVRQGVFYTDLDQAPMPEPKDWSKGN